MIFRVVITAQTGSYHMGDRFEEEKVVVEGDFDQHDDASGDEVKKGYDVDAAQHVEDHVSWTSQGSFEQGSDSHCRG
jgi:hypothetical protein